YRSSDRFVYPPPPATPFSDVTAGMGIRWKHQENDYNDFNSHRLLPHLLSTHGPAMAVADVNGDGLDDIYVGGASGQKGLLLVQLASGQFTELAGPTTVPTEETAAVFFDADGDGDQDLFVASGGNDRSLKDPAINDHLYLNDGKGGFTQHIFPPLSASKSTVSVADVDHDGDADLFIGVLTAAFDYGLLPASYLLLNDGHANFSAAPRSMIDLHIAGMVSSSAFADVNADGWTDLVLAGEWMPVTVYLNKNGKFSASQLSGSEGLWQSVTVADLDHDGHPDLLAGNYGLNSKLHASNENPLRMYVKDFDHNGQPEQILTYSTEQKEYSFLGKDELEVQLPVMKKSYLRYQDFAGKTIQEIFAGQLDDVEPFKCVTLSSGVFRNDGKGNFTFEALPDEAQYSPVFAMLADDVNGDGRTDLLTAGNFFGVSPYEGRYDANRGFLFLSGKNGFEFMSPGRSGFVNPGESRDLKKIKTARGWLYVAAHNNAGLQFFRLSENVTQ
ncbi:MAG: VCBS repeat-containing protein, partial [Chitinophagaceae bacterium]